MANCSANLGHSSKAGPYARLREVVARTVLGNRPSAERVGDAKEFDSYRRVTSGATFALYDSELANS